MKEKPEDFFCDWMQMDRCDLTETDMYFVKCMKAFAKQSCKWQIQICAGEVVKKGYGSTVRNERIILSSPLPIIFEQ